MSDHKRLPRNRRVPVGERPPLKLTDRDREIIKAVNDFRALRSTHIHRLFFGSSPSATHSRLVRLFQHGYLDRQFLSLFSGNSAAIPPLYTIGKKGAQLLIENYGYELADLRIPKKDFSWQFIEHLLKINDFRVAVTLSARAHGWQIETWEDERVFKASTDYVTLKASNGQPHERPVLPDSYFCLVTDKGRAHFFLEIDRGREPERTFKPQVQVYEEYCRSGGYQARYSKTSLRILVVTTTPKRITTLKAITTKAEGDDKYWFTTFDMVQPETVLTAPIWQKLRGSPLVPLVPT